MSVRTCAQSGFLPAFLYSARIARARSRTTATYALRVSHLRTGIGGLNGANKLTGAITDDIATDTMAGASGQDWFFARVTAPADILSDRASNENLN